MLKSRRPFLHRNIAERLRDNFPAIAAAEPELLAHHFTQATLPEAAIEWWGKAAQQSLERSALIEAIEQLTRALSQIALAPSTPALRRQEIKLQVALITPLMNVKGYAAPETRAATDRGQLLIEQAEALGESPEDPLLLFSVLHGQWTASGVAFNGDALLRLSGEFVALAERHGTNAPLLLAYRNRAIAFLYTGDIAEGCAYLDRAIALYDPAARRSLATQFAQDARAQSLSYRSLALWLLGYPDAATADADRALSHARDIGQAATLMNMLAVTSFTNIFLGKYQAISAQGNELVALSDETRSLYWQARGTCLKGLLFALSDRPSEAVHSLTSGMAARLATGSTAFGPTYLSHLAAVHADLGRFDGAWRCVREAATAVETSKERWYEAEANRIAGGIALKSPEPDAAKAEGYFERALAVARAQQAKSWELRAAMSMARLWRDQGKRDEARDLLAPVYGWFTEGFDTLDLKEAKGLLDELVA